MKPNNSQSRYSIPILFIFFNRKEIALKAFKHIKPIRPTKLYLAQDGARCENGDFERDTVLDIRETILAAIDWDCEVFTLFRTENLGCALGVKTAIDWLFLHEEYGIILEDDCIVSDSFFPFMADILQRYRTDQRVGMVAGTNPIKKFKARSSFHFSRFKSCWGWGTWSRAWENMDYDMKWRETDKMSVINNSGFNGRHTSKWRFQLRCIDQNIVSSWDWQWYFTLASQNQLCVYPAVNLVSNIGNDSEATHTSFSNITLQSGHLDFPLISPSVVAPDYVFDRMFDANENTITVMFTRLLPHSIKSLIKRLLK